MTSVAEVDAELPAEFEYWRWQFLRRSTAYQAAFREHSDADAHARAAVASGFGLADLVDPAVDEPSAWQLNHRAPELIVSLDLRRPTAELLSFTRASIAAARKRRQLRVFSENPQQLALYLQVLDARASGCLLKQIACAIGYSPDHDGEVRAGGLLRQAEAAQRRICDLPSHETANFSPAATTRT